MRFRLVKRFTVIVLLFTLLLSSTCEEKKVYQSVDNINQWEQFESALLIEINLYREDSALLELSADKNLQQFAEARAIHYKELGKIDNHIGFGELSGKLHQLGLDGIAENLAHGYPTPQKTISAWKKSTLHNEILLRYDRIYCGIGMVEDGKKTYICLLIAK